MGDIVKIFPQWFINLCYFIVLCIEWTCRDVEYIGMMSILVQAMLLYYLDNITSMNDKTCKALGHFLTLGGMSFIKWNFPIESEEFLFYFNVPCFGYLLNNSTIPYKIVIHFVKSSNDHPSTNYLVGSNQLDHMY
jgi:hypothetical protein